MTKRKRKNPAPLRLPTIAAQAARAQTIRLLRAAIEQSEELERSAKLLGDDVLQDHAAATVHLVDQALGELLTSVVPHQERAA